MTRTLSRAALTERLKGLEKLIELRAQLTDKALNEANNANEYRLETMNNFRDDLEKQARNFLTKEEYDTRHKAVEDKIETCEKALTNRVAILEKQSFELKGRQGLSTPLIAIIAAIIGATIGFVIQTIYKAMAHLAGG